MNHKQLKPINKYCLANGERTTYQYKEVGKGQIIVLSALAAKKLKKQLKRKFNSLPHFDKQQFLKEFTNAAN